MNPLNLFISIAHADDDNILWMPSAKLRSGDITFSDLPHIILNVTNFIIEISATVSFIMIIYAALKMGMSFGEKSKIDDAKDTIRYALWWFVVTSCSWLIVKIVFSSL